MCECNANVTSVSRKFMRVSLNETLDLLYGVDFNLRNQKKEIVKKIHKILLNTNIST